MLALTIRERIHGSRGDSWRWRLSPPQGREVSRRLGNAYFKVYEHRWTAERTTVPCGAMSVSNIIKHRVCIDVYKE